MADEAKTNRPLRIRLTDKERIELDRAAAKVGKTTAAWARELLLKNARR